MGQAKHDMVPDKRIACNCVYDVFLYLLISRWPGKKQRELWEPMKGSLQLYNLEHFKFWGNHPFGMPHFFSHAHLFLFAHFCLLTSGANLLLSFAFTKIRPFFICQDMTLVLRGSRVTVVTSCNYIALKIQLQKSACEKMLAMVL